MAAHKHHFHLAMVIDGTALHEIMLIASGRAYDLKVSPVKPEKPKASPPPPITGGDRLTAVSFVEAYARAHERFLIGDVLTAGEQFGLGKGNIYGALSIAVKKLKQIKRAKPGIYISRTYDGSPPPMLRLAPPDAKANGSTPQHEFNGHAINTMTHIEFILHTIKSAHPNTITSHAIRAAFVKSKRRARSMDSPIDKLKKRGMVKVVEKGVYTLTAKGAAYGNV